ncbi:MAG: hypothetical protein J1F33_07105 [Clostridiales bacterium]|nr:hypothetical protein [Clostridiales bacterium]
MKNIKNLMCMALAILSVCLFGAWAPADASRTEDRYADATIISLYATETITFDSKETDSKINFAPQYTVISGLKNACGAVAGTEVVAYYDKYYPNMIPEWESFFAASGRYRAQDSVYIPGVMNELYTLMRTNVDVAGVSASDFVNGLTKYINGKGYSAGMQSVLSGTTVDYAACKSAIDNNKVITLLSQPVDVYSVVEGNNQDSISTLTIPENHIMVASGYKEIKYYKNGALFRTDKYLVVSTGLDVIKLAYYKLNNHKLKNAYIVNIS